MRLCYIEGRMAAKGAKGADPAVKGAEARAGKQEKILAAAAAVFAAKGYFGARVSEIAQRAGIADGTIYLYFRSKEDILMGLFEMAMQRFLGSVRQELAHIPGARERLRHVALQHLEALGSNRDLAIVFQVELRQSTKFMQRFSTTLLAEYFDIIRGVIRDGQGQGVFRRDMNEKIVTKCFFGALDEMATNWVLSERRYRLADMAPIVADLFLHGMLAATPGGKPAGLAGTSA